jgi:hypothetical protein
MRPVYHGRFSLRKGINGASGATKSARFIVGPSSPGKRLDAGEGSLGQGFIASDLFEGSLQAQKVRSKTFAVEK